MAPTLPALKKLAKPRESDSGAGLSGAVYETLLEAILGGTLASGTILSEVALAKQLDVSRTPVHDALRQLAKDGLVEQAVGRRARVSRFTPDDLYEIFELRKFLEGPAAELAAGRMDQRQLAPLRRMADDLASSMGAVNWVAQWTDFDETFHSTIAIASGNRRLAEDISRYRMLHRGFNRMHRKAESLKEALEEHVQILNALDRRDGAAARTLMHQHIEHWQHYFVRGLLAE